MTHIAVANGKTVLVSGINGFVGAHVGLQLLQKGYSVRGTARNVSSADALLSTVYKDYADRVQIVSVADFTTPGAFDEAVKGVSAIMHVASPAVFNLEKLSDYVEPAVGGTVNMLESALRHAGPQLEAYVQTSSVAAVMTFGEQRTFTAADWNVAGEKEAAEKADASPPALCYQASKVASERALWRWKDEHKPSFSISAVHPSLVYGPPLVDPKDPANLPISIQPVWKILSGEPIPPSYGSGNYIDVRDIAAIHIWAMEHPDEANGQRYLMAAGKGTCQAIADILRKHYPERKHLIQEGHPGMGYEKDFAFESGGIIMESSPAKAALGGFRGFEDAVVETARAMETHL